MRFRYVPEQERDSDREQRRSLYAEMDAFWRAWRSQGPERARTFLERVDRRLLLEPYAARFSEPEWVVAVESAAAVPLRDALFERAPEAGPLPLAGRPRLAEPFSDAPASSELSELDLAKSRVRVGVGRGHLLHVVLDARTRDGKELSESTAEELVETLLGEQLFLRWIGSVDVQALPKPSGLPVLQAEAVTSYALTELTRLVDVAVAGIVAALPETPLSAEREHAWHSNALTLFELEPPSTRAADFAAQDDAVLVSTWCPELVKAFLEGAPFFSGRFSAHGELFAYLKYESPTGTSEARLAERDRLEADLHATLTRASLGDMIGTGVGLRYTYVDLALGRVDDALPILADVARSHALSERAWLLFFDSELAEEWVALGARESEPPGF